MKQNMCQLLASYLFVCVAVGLVLGQNSSRDNQSGQPSLPTDNGGVAGNAGGVTQGDFNPLLNLIQQTIDTEIWPAGGGSATLIPYVQGVYADAQGILQFKKPDGQNRPEIAPKIRPLVDRASRTSKEKGNPRVQSELRFVSLRRLENFLAHQIQQRQPLGDEVLTLAGLQRIEHVIMVPSQGSQQGDVLLAGPAGDWQTTDDGIIISVDTLLPVVRIDDLLTLWRRERPSEPFGVTINPKQSRMAALQQYLQTTTAAPIKPNRRKQWVAGMGETLGAQEVQFFGLEPNSHVAKVLLAADYHMKLIGMGVADPVDGVSSYLSTVKLDPNGQVPPMSILRWWFAMDYQPVQVSRDQQVYSLFGQGAKVLSENQLMAARGQRIATGKSEPLNRLFASSFSQQFKTICQKYPVYGELKNVFDLSMAITLIQERDLLDQANWHPELLLDERALKLPNVQVAQQVDTIVNHRVIKGKTIVAGISGGVWVDAINHLKQEPDLQNVNADRWDNRDLKTRPTEPETDQELIWWWD